MTLTFCSLDFLSEYIFCVRKQNLISSDYRVHLNLPIAKLCTLSNKWGAESTFSCSSKVKHAMRREGICLDSCEDIGNDSYVNKAPGWSRGKNKERGEEMAGTKAQGGTREESSIP